MADGPRLGSSQFYEILPPNLARDKTTRDVADSLDSCLHKSDLALPALLIYARLALAGPDLLVPPLMRLADLAGGLSLIPEPLLDMLAWQFHVDGYEAANSYEDKRRLVDRSILMHRRKGTPWAVAEALRALGYADAKIFEGCGICRHDGEIIHNGHDNYSAGNRWALFDVEIDLGDGMGISAASVLRLRVAIEAWKNARSHLRVIRWRATISDEINIDEWLDKLAVHLAFYDIRPWGFPCHDGSIRYDNGNFRLHDGRLDYSGANPHSLWQAKENGYQHNCLLDPLRLSAQLSFASLVRPDIRHDGWFNHSGESLHGKSEAPALDKLALRVPLNGFSETVPFSEQTEINVGLRSLDWMFRAHNGSFTHGPHCRNGAFRHDASYFHDSGSIRKHDGRELYSGAAAHNRWLRTGPLYNSRHDFASFALGAKLEDSAKFRPDYAGSALSHNGELRHGKLNACAIDDLRPRVSASLTEKIEITEKSKGTVKSAFSDSIGRAHDGSLSHGQQAMRCHNGTSWHNGANRSGPTGSVSLARFTHSGVASHSGMACHRLWGNSANAVAYSGLADKCAFKSSMALEDTVSYSQGRNGDQLYNGAIRRGNVDKPAFDLLRTSLAARLEDSAKPEERMRLDISASAKDEFSHSHNGEITHGQARVSLRLGSVQYSGSRSHSISEIGDCLPALRNGAARRNGILRHRLWGKPFSFTYSAPQESWQSSLEMEFADSLALRDELEISVWRIGRHGGNYFYNSQKTHQGRVAA